MSSTTQFGKFIGIGVGPGDPELLTLKAARLINEADVIAYLVGESGQSQAKHIARYAFETRVARHTDIEIIMPMSTDRGAANQAYDQGAEAIVEQLQQGRDVVFLCEGDPLFFGSFAYLMERLTGNFAIEVVPGISSVNAASAALQTPLTAMKESFVVVSGRHSEEKLAETLAQYDSVVIMKAGRARPKILQALAQTGRTADAEYLEYIGRDNQLIERDVTKLANEIGPYFSLFVVTPNSRNSR